MATFNQYDEVIVNNTAPITARGLRGRVIKTDDNGAWIAYSGVARGGGWYPEGELSLVDTVDTPSQPDIAQQLADAIARAERAERQVTVLKAFVEGLADVAGDTWPRREPIRAEYGSWDAFDRDMRTWDLKVKARKALEAAEKALEDKAVGDGTDYAPTEAR